MVSAFFGWLSLITAELHAQTVTFNDNDLKTYLLTQVDAAGGGNGDGQIQTSEALTLTELFYQGNGLTDATGLEAFTNLEELYLDNNSLSSIDLSPFVNLIDLSLNSNDFETIDVSALASLQTLSISNNSLTALNVSDLSSLKSLIAGSNNLTEMDLSSNDQLTVVKLHYNDLESLNLRNGANATLSTLLITNNSNLTCVEVDDVTDATGYAGWTKGSGTSYAISCEPIVTVNDSNFKTYLLGQVDSNADGEIQVSEAEGFSGTISYRDKGEAFSDATGLEAFINVSTIFIDRNNLSSLDVSQNTGLTKLVAYTNPISTINLSTNVLLEELYLGFTNIEILDMSNLPELRHLEMIGTPLHTLDLDNNTKLETLIIYDNDLSELDLTTNVLLSDLKIHSNDISELSLTTNTMLTELWAHNLSLSQLDLSANSALSIVYLQNNNLQEFQIDNGNNGDISQLNLTGNVDLRCIQVDNVASADANEGWLKDASAYYVTDCEIVTVNDTAFETYLLGLVDSNADGYIQVSEAENLMGSIDYANKGLSDATGLEAFVNATKINLSQNSLETIDLSQNTKITQLRLYNNDLVALDLSANDQLDYIMAYNNDLSVFELNTDCPLLAIDLSNNPNLSSFDPTNYPDLRYLALSSTGISNVNITENPDLTYLQLSGTNISSLDISNNLLLQTLGIGNLGFNGFDLSNHTALEYITVSGNTMGDLDLSNHSNLIRLYAHDAGLTTLNIRNDNNSAILTLSVQDNPNLTCIITDDSSIPSGRTGWSKDASARYDDECLPTVTVNDESLETYLLTLVDAANGGNDDGYIQVSEAENFTGAIIHRNQSLSDITGLDAFVNITRLDLGVNQISSLDPSVYTDLIYLNLNENELSTINVSENSFLEELRIAANANITTVDVLDNPELHTLYLFNTSIEDVDVTSNLKLRTLAVQNLPNLTALNLANNTELSALEIYNTGISELDVSGFSNLYYLDISSTEITFLDLSQNGNLEYVAAENTSLAYLNLKNGNHALLEELYLEGNPNLTCIEVDDVAYAEANWTNIDEIANYNTECRDEQEITLATINDKLTTDGSFEVSVASTSELDVDLSVSGPATVDGYIITLDGTAGTVTVFANQSGNESFQPAIEKSVSFEVVKAAQSLTITAIEDKLTTDESFEVSASSTSELEVTLSVSGPATINGTTITLDGTAGTVTVFGNQSGNDMYAAADEASITFEVTEPAAEKQSQTISISAIADKLTTDGPFTVSATSTSGLAVDLTVSGPASIDENGIITLDGTVGTVTVTANQAGDDAFEAADEVIITFEVSEPVVNAVPQSLSVNIYPNPASEWISVDGITSEADFQLLNTDGHLVIRKKIKKSDLVDISAVAKGMYILRIAENNSYTTTKVLIQR